jgi:hypothetical protein
MTWPLRWELSVALQYLILHNVLAEKELYLNEKTAILFCLNMVLDIYGLTYCINKDDALVALIAKYTRAM